MQVRTIICLANSRKTSGRCIAGKVHEEGAPANWLRPVSSAEDQEISEQHRRYSNGKRAKLLHVISIPIKSHAPKAYQQENHLIDEGYHWEKVGRANRALLEQLVDQDFTTLWINNGSEFSHNSYHGENDRFPLAEANTIDSSLAFIWVERVRLRSLAESAHFGDNTRKVRAFFEWHGISYALAVTDPFIEEMILDKPNGDHYIDDAFMCISLGVPYKDNVYKLVASIITPERLN